MIRILKKWPLCTSVGIGLLLAGQLQTTLLAQEDEEDVYDLSPFVIDSSEDSGYQATSSLAGTRLKTSLRDIGASVSVITADFMDDINADDIGDLLAYTGGTETGGVRGNFANPNVTENAGRAREERILARPQKNTRIRGLAQGDLTQDYFLTDAPFDSFNIDRITINRGPNAALFGLGSPGGVLNATLKRAIFDDFGSLEFKFDNWGTQRAVLDVNRELIEDVVALRVAWLEEEIEFEQNQAFERDSRIYAAIQFKPTETTTIRANYTQGHIDAARPTVLPPQDRVSVWHELGQPLYDPLQNEYFASMSDWQNSNPLSGDIRQEYNSNVFNGMANNQNMTYFFADQNSPSLGGNGTPTAAVLGIRNNFAFAPNGTVNRTWRTNQESRNVYRADPALVNHPLAQNKTNDEIGFFSSRRVEDRGMFDYRENLLSGPNKAETGDLESWSATLEQTFLDNRAGFELSFYEEKYNDNLVEWARDLRVDINVTLPDGSLNPNLGRMFSGGNNFAEPQYYEQEAKRFTAFAEHNFADGNDDNWLRHLGRHVLTFLASEQANDFTRETHFPGAAGNEFKSYIFNQDTTQINGRNRPDAVRYIGDSLLGVSSLSNVNPGGINVRQPLAPSSNVMIYDYGRALAIQDGNGDLLPGASVSDAVITNGSVHGSDHVDDPEASFEWGHARSRTETDSLVAVLQSRFLEDHIVTTVSWREDDVIAWNENAGERPRNPTTGQGVPGAELPLNESPFLEESTDITAFSVVAHAPDFVKDWFGGWEPSIHYNEASNFASTGAAVTILGDTIPLQSGETEEFGFAFRSPDNKFDLRVTWYESAQINGRINPVARHQAVLASVLENNTPQELAAIPGWSEPPQSYFDTNRIEVVQGENRVSDTGVELTEWNSGNPQQLGVRSTADSVSEGMELELTYNPTPNWRIHLNVAQQEAIQSNIAPATIEYMEARRTAIWQNPSVAENIWMSTDRERDALDEMGMPIPDGDGGFVQEPNPNSRMLNPETGELHPQVANQLAALVSGTKNEGLSVTELREWRWNLITNYEFASDNGWLDGFGIGGAIRWQDNIAIGNPLILVDGAFTPDVNNPYFGPDETKLDLWITYKTELDIFDGVDLRLRLGARNITSDEGLIPVNMNPDRTVGTWRIEEPTAYELTGTFSF